MKIIKKIARKLRESDISYFNQVDFHFPTWTTPTKGKTMHDAFKDLSKTIQSGQGRYEALDRVGWAYYNQAEGKIIAKALTPECNVGAACGLIPLTDRQSKNDDVISGVAESIKEISRKIKT